MGACRDEEGALHRRVEALDGDLAEARAKLARDEGDEAGAPPRGNLSLGGPTKLVRERTLPGAS